MFNDGLDTRVREKSKNICGLNNYRDGEVFFFS